MIRIALLRHFPTAWNAERRLQGRSDIPLSPEGRAALARHRLPAGWEGAAILASPLARAAETARVLAGGRPVATDPRLVEMDFGGWEGRLATDIETRPDHRPVEEWGRDFRPPGGESPAEMTARLRPLLAGIAGPALLVTHRGVIRCILAMATGWDWLGAEPFRVRSRALHPVLLDPAGRPVAIEPPVKLPARTAP